MEEKQVIDRLKQDVQQLRQDGHSVIAVEALDDYLARLSQDAGDSVELAKSRQQLSLARYDAQNKANLELFKSVIDAGKDALNAALIINGGAILAMLSFLGATASRGSAERLGLALTTPLLSFGCGIFAAAVTFGVRYLTQDAFHRNYTRWGNSLLVFTVIFGAVAFGAFGYGVWRAYLAFTTHFAGAVASS